MPDERALRLLEQMRLSSSNWKRRDIEQLYRAFGFEIRHGSKHDVVTHPQHPDLRATLARHNALAKGYVRAAVNLVDELLRRTAQEDTGKLEDTDDERS